MYSNCPVCNNKLFKSYFDITFRLDDGTEKFIFALPACLCEPCQQLYLDSDLADLLNLQQARCTYAIENDKAYQSRVKSDL